MLNGKNIVAESSSGGSPMGFCATHRFSILTSGNSIDDSHRCIEEWLTSLRADSHANHFLSLASTTVNPIPETNGQKRQDALASYSPDMHYWKTSQTLLFTDTSDEYSGIWPKWGTIVNGALYPRMPWAHPIAGGDYGYWPTPRAGSAEQYETRAARKGHQVAMSYLESAVDYVENHMWPTPTVQDAENDGGDSQYNRNTIPLNAIVKMFPTPTKIDAIKGGNVSPRPGMMGLSEKSGGQLNPPWVAWLMGWPIGWTELKCLEMDGYRRWLKIFCGLK